MNVQIIHIPGADNELADALSRPVGMMAKKNQILEKIGHVKNESTNKLK